MINWFYFILHAFIQFFCAFRDARLEQAERDEKRIMFDLAANIEFEQEV